MLKIKDAVAAITGGTGGIGAELSKYWVSQGGKVVLGDVSAEGLTRVAHEIKARGKGRSLIQWRQVVPPHFCWFLH
jgi:NADP-dependent 3-hydroxy acid dehydrogenase YdfG